jgi:hypothetical protein
MTYKFTVEKAGKTYQCERAVTGKGELRQIIHVAGVGSKKDSVIYGASKHSVSTMSSAAQRIAHEIIHGI